jgi:hypothetical protein
MSPAFIAGTTQSLPNAAITFDKFHLVKLINEAVDAVRRAEQKSRTELKNSRYLWLKNPPNLSERQRTQLDSLAGAKLKTGRAYRIRLAFQELYLQPAASALVPLYRAVDPVSTLMLWRWAKRARVERLVVPIDRMIPILPRSVIAAEDDRFCSGGKYDPTSSPRRAEPPPRYITATINRHDGPEDGGLSERCLTGGLPEFGTAFGGSFRRIVQTPGGISMFYDVGRGQGWQRHIVMNGSPHLPARIGDQQHGRIIWLFAESCG